MSDSLRTNPPSSLEPTALDAARAVKIERMLLSGLEHYLVAEYDQAINVWTRALFLDRGQARARAYIERARSAQAELQRQSEELLQRGVTAFKLGEGEEARRLLQDAMDQGAPPEEALAMLERINHLAHVSRSPARVPSGRWRFLTRVGAAATTRSRARWAAFSLTGLVIVSTAVFASGVFRPDWPPSLERTPGLGGLRPPAGTLPLPLPLPLRGETALARARVLVQGGRLRDALGALDGVRSTDALRPEADRLRADVQKRLVALAAMTGVASSDHAQVPREP